MKSGNFQQTMSKNWKFNLFLIRKLPLAFIVGLGLDGLDERSARITLPYRWLNSNPFKSMYFACLTMAAELSTGILLMNLIDKSPHSFSMLVTEVHGYFHKRGLGFTTFECLDGQKIVEAIQLAIDSSSPQIIQLQSVGYNEAKEILCRFEFTWSIKMKG